ncbi:hypothetical protein PG995_002005 [Apiospora arundinis]
MGSQCPGPLLFNIEKEVGSRQLLSILPRLLLFRFLIAAIAACSSRVRILRCLLLLFLFLLLLFPGSFQVFCAFLQSPLPLFFEQPRPLCRRGPPLLQLPRLLRLRPALLNHIITSLLAPSDRTSQFIDRLCLRVVVPQVPVIHQQCHGRFPVVAVGGQVLHEQLLPLQLPRPVLKTQAQILGPDRKVRSATPAHDGRHAPVLDKDVVQVQVPVRQREGLQVRHELEGGLHVRPHVGFVRHHLPPQPLLVLRRRAELHWEVVVPSREVVALDDGPSVDTLHDRRLELAPPRDVPTYLAGVVLALLMCELVPDLGQRAAAGALGDGNGDLPFLPRRNDLGHGYGHGRWYRQPPQGLGLAAARCHDPDCAAAAARPRPQPASGPDAGSSPDARARCNDGRGTRRSSRGRCTAASGCY